MTVCRNLCTEGKLPDLKWDTVLVSGQKRKRQLRPVWPGTKISILVWDGNPIPFLSSSSQSDPPFFLFRLFVLNNWIKNSVCTKIICGVFVLCGEKKEDTIRKRKQREEMGRKHLEETERLLRIAARQTSRDMGRASDPLRQAYLAAARSKYEQTNVGCHQRRYALIQLELLARQAGVYHRCTCGLLPHPQSHLPPHPQAVLWEPLVCRDNMSSRPPTVVFPVPPQGVNRGDSTCPYRVLAVAKNSSARARCFRTLVSRHFPNTGTIYFRTIPAKEDLRTVNTNQQESTKRNVE